MVKYSYAAGNRYVHMLIVEYKVVVFNAGANSLGNGDCGVFCSFVQQNGEFFAAVTACKVFFAQVLLYERDLLPPYS